MMIFRNGKHAGDISPFQSLMTALAATVGTGNIVVREKKGEEVDYEEIIHQNITDK